MGNMEKYSAIAAYVNLETFTLIFHSIEEKMLAIQDKKRKLIAGAFRQSDNERRQQRIQDIRDIFGL